MRISKRDANLLMVFLGLLMVLVVYFVPVANYSEETEQLVAQTNALKPELAALEEHQRKIPEYNEGIEAAKVGIAAERDLYAEEVRTEDCIMYAVMLEREYELGISSASFVEPQAVKTLNSMNEQGQMADFTAYSTNMSLVCRMGYENLKQAINRLYQTADKTMLDSVSVSYDPETAGLVGTLNIAKLFVADGDYEYVPTPVEYGPLGTLNPFGTLTPPEVPEGEVETTDQ